MTSSAPPVLALADFPEALRPHARRNEHYRGRGTPDDPYVGGWVIARHAVSYDDDAKHWLRAHGFRHHGGRWMRPDLA